MWYNQYRGRSCGRILHYIEMYCGLQYADTIHKEYDEVTNLMMANGINVHQLAFGPGGHYVGRKVVARRDPTTGEIDLAVINRKATFDETRSFTTQEEALNAGYTYMAPEEVLQINMEAAYRKIAEKRVADFIVANLAFRDGATPAVLEPR